MVKTKRSNVVVVVVMVKCLVDTSHELRKKTNKEELAHVMYGGGGA